MPPVEGLVDTTGAGNTGSNPVVCLRGWGGTTEQPESKNVRAAMAAKAKRCMVCTHMLLLMKRSMPSTAEMALELTS